MNKVLSKISTTTFLTLIGLVFVNPHSYASPTAEQTDRNIAVYLLLPGQVGLQGFDPVSYFVEGGGNPLAGKMEFTASYGGVSYFFANSKNKDQFLNEPLKYEPTYGGWCAWAMANDDFAEIDPFLFSLVKQENGVFIEAGANDPDARRLNFFIARGAKARFDNDLNGNQNLADGFWAQDLANPGKTAKAGEQPRL